MRTPSVGQPVLRKDGADKVTGQASFVDDLAFSGLLHAAVARSDRPHALLRELDTHAAEQQEGVWAVYRGDPALPCIGECIRDHRIIATDRVRFVGEPLAVVIAEDRRVARAAAAAVRADYEDLPAAITVDAALAEGAPLIHPELGSYAVLPNFHPQPGSNVYHAYRTERGDVDQALRQAPHVVEGTYSLPHIAHVQLEPHAAVALWSSPQDLTVWATAQSPHLVRQVLAELFDLPLTRVRVVVPYLGGGFGGKSDTTIEPLVAAAARRVIGRPVKLVLSREEMFYGSVLGRGAQIRVRTGHDEQGRLLAADVDLAFRCGAYGEYAINVVEGAGHIALGTYSAPALRIASRAVYTNTPFVGAFRGYGHPEAHWGIERHMDHVADVMGLDPDALRRRNLLRPGDHHPTGQLVEASHGDLRGCFDAVRRRLDALTGPPSGPDKLRGVAVSPLMKAPIMATDASSAARIRLNADGTFDLSVGGTEMGQGSRTALAQVAAQALDVPVERVRLAPGVDTEAAPYEWQTVGSTSTWKIGQAIRAAAAEVHKQLTRNAALQLEIPPSQITRDGDTFADAEAPERQVALTEIALRARHPNGHAEGGPVSGYGSFTPRGVETADAKGKGNLAGEWTVGANGAVVEVDRRTGEIHVVALVTALDAGRIVNPTLAEGQVKGAMAQGLGAALLEAVVYGQDGQIRNAGLTDYKIPTPSDILDGQLEVIFLETPFDEGPFGARCIGEHGLVAVAPAIANAVRDATGVHMDHLPLDPPSVLAGMEGTAADRFRHKHHRLAPAPAKSWRYARPSSIKQARIMLAEPGAIALAGGTDVMVKLRSGELHASLIVDLKGLPGLRELRDDGETVFIGALTTATDVLESELLATRLGALVDAAREFGCQEVRNRATVGGNLANASPGAEFNVPLVALEATVFTASGLRLPIREFLTGPGHTAMQADDLVLGVQVPAKASRSAYARYARTEGMDLAAVSLAMVLHDDGRIALSMGAVEGVPPRPATAEGILSEGILSEGPLTPARLARAGRALVADLHPRPGSLRAPPTYKLAILPVMLERLAQRLFEVPHA